MAAFTIRLSNILPPTTTWNGYSEKRWEKSATPCSPGSAVLLLTSLTSRLFILQLLCYAEQRMLFSLGSDQCFHYSFFPLVTPVSWWVECLTQRSKHLSQGQNKTKNKQKRFIGERAAPYPQALERKPQICVLIISSVSASNSEDPCQRGELLWESCLEKTEGRTQSR